MAVPINHKIIDNILTIFKYFTFFSVNGVPSLEVFKKILLILSIITIVNILAKMIELNGFIAVWLDLIALLII